MTDLDISNHPVQILNSDLPYSSTIGKQDSGDGEFDYPWGMSYWEGDCNNHRIQIFTAE